MPSLAEPKCIILHHSLTVDSGTVSWDAIRRYHVQHLGWADIGYHFGVEFVNDHYEIFTGRMMNEIGAHCRQDKMNYRSLGIMFNGNFDFYPPPEGQWVLGLRLVRSLMDVFGIPKGSVLGHNYFAKYKTCPGKMFDVAKFQAELVG